MWFVVNIFELPIIFFTNTIIKIIIIIILTKIIMSELTNTTNEQSKQAADSLTKIIEEDPHDIIHFIDAGSKAEDIKSFSEVQTVNNDSEIRSIGKLLSRPVKVNSFTYSTDNAVGQPVFQMDLGDALNAMPLARKLDCFYGFRATLCCEIRVNPQPFHTGAFQVAYIPPAALHTVDTAGVLGNYRELNSRIDVASIPFMSGLSDCTIFNVAKQTTLKIKRPYKWIYDYCPLNNLNLGVIFLQSLSPLGSTVADGIEGSFYFWLEDLEIIGSAAQTFPFTQWYSYTHTGGSTMGVQVERQGPSQKAEASSKLSVSSVAKTVSNISGALTKIPFVSDIAGPVSMAADVVSNVAGFFGFSKPYNPKPFTKVSEFKSHGKLNTDGLFMGHKLTYNEHAEVETSPLGLVPEDEMAVSYVAQKWTRWNWFAWDVANSAGTQLVGWENSPGRYENLVSPYWGADIRATTYLSYLSHMFAYWRGSIRFRLHFLANQFYSGRLRIVYDVAGELNATQAFERSSEMYSVVLDIKDANEQVIELPYISQADWAPCHENLNRYSTNRFPGVLRIYVENELRTNPNCPSAIYVWIDVAGGDDIQFAVPVHHKNTAPNSIVAPIVPPAQQQQKDETPYDETDIGVNINREAPENVLRLANDEVRDKPTIRSMIDPVVSLRQLTRRYEPLDRNIIAGGFNPWASETTDVNFYNWVKRLYAYSTGGMRIWQPTPYGTDADRAFLYLAPHYATYKFASDVLTDMIAVTQIRPANGDLMEYEIPYYNAFPRVAHQDQNFVSSENFAFRAGIHSPLTRFGFQGAASTLYAATADDWNCGYLLGPRWIWSHNNFTLDNEARTGPGPAIIFN